MRPGADTVMVITLPSGGTASGFSAAEALPALVIVTLRAG